MTARAPISAIAPGDIVLAFSPEAAQGRSALVPARVTRLMRNVTEEWLVVRPAPGFEAIAAANGFTELTVTPGHETLDAQGRFRPIIDILNDEAELVLADGTVMRVVCSTPVFGVVQYQRQERIGCFAVIVLEQRRGAADAISVRGLRPILHIASKCDAIYGRERAAVDFFASDPRTEETNFKVRHAHLVAGRSRERNLDIILH